MFPVSSWLQRDQIGKSLLPTWMKKRSAKEAKMLLPSSIEIAMSLRLVQAGNKSLDLFRQYLMAIDIDVTHFCILFTLAEQGPLPQLELGQQLEIGRAPMVHYLDYWERRKLAKRVPNSLNRRFNTIVLTPQGLEITLKAHEMAQQLEAKLFTALSTEEQTQLRDLMSRLDLSGI
jgi:MarR family transcriptional regulator, 2-MHQ and catechol-resistance regulon repressor